MRIFLTGSTGFLGKAMMTFMAGHEWFQYKRGQDVESCLEMFSPDVVIHSAAEIYDELRMYGSNVLLTAKILRWISRNKNVKLVYFGSSSEYGITDKPMRETDECVPVTFYAFTKLNGTMECQKLKDNDITILRPFSVYGPFEPEHRLIPTLYAKLRNGSPMTAITGTHDFIYIKDFVKAVDLVINAPARHGEIYNVGFGRSYTNEEIVKTMCGLLGTDGKNVKYVDDRKRCDSPLWVSDSGKIQREFGFSCEYTIDKGLAEYILWKEKTND